MLFRSVGAGASGSVYAATLAKAGKKVVIFDNGPDWQLQDLISSEMWGRRIRPAGAPVLLDGKNPFGYTAQAGWGVGGAALMADLVGQMMVGGDGILDLAEGAVLLRQGQMDTDAFFVLNGRIVVEREESGRHRITRSAGPGDRARACGGTRRTPEASSRYARRHQRH